MALWKINCMEDEYPGMWQRWFKQQCVAVGWPSKWGYRLRGRTKSSRGWSLARRLLEEIRVGDQIVVSLRGHRVGRIGQVTGKAIEDEQWDPLVPPRPGLRHGEMGRRIFVRWDLETGPDDREMIVVLPKSAHLSRAELRPTIAKVRSQTVTKLRRAMNDPANWAGLLARFYYERSLSDFIAAYPHRLEDGLLPYPQKKVREGVLSDRRRLDVLLQDRRGVPVIVECKQLQPTIADIRQLQGYLKRLQAELKLEQKPRGILVHGGAAKLRTEVRRAARAEPAVELVQYRVEVDFVISR